MGRANKKVSNGQERQNECRYFQDGQQVVRLINLHIIIDSQFDGIQFYSNQYQYQPNFAFIKGFTLVIQGVKFIVKMIDEILRIPGGNEWIFTSTELQILILILINKILFCLTAFKVQRISLTFTEDKVKAYNITLLYLYNPACVFFYSIYTESIYAFFTFTSIQYLLKNQKETQQITQNQLVAKTTSIVNKNFAKSLLFLWLATFFRTNAVFLSPVFGLPIIYQLWLQIHHKNIAQIIKIFIKGTFILSIILSPLLYYQLYVYQQLCHSEVDLLNDKKLVIQCNKLIPNLYSFIQQKFWNVGLFSYWKTSNSVFILIGAFSLIISSPIFYKIFTFFKDKKEKANHFSFIRLSLYLSFVILFIVTFTMTNIQSSTRFFSTHIVFYFIIHDWLQYKITKFWISLYYSFGAILFFIGFPWT